MFRNLFSSRMEDGRPLQLHPKRILSLSRGKFERGTLPLSIKEEIPRAKALGMTQ